MPLNNDLIYTVANRNKAKKQKTSNPKRKHTSQNGNLIAKTRKIHNQKTGTQSPETALVHHSKGKDTYKKPKTATVTDQN